MAKIIKTTFQVKRGLAADLERVNPILAPGEPVWALDTGVLKVGNNKGDRWNDLPSVSDIQVSREDIENAVNKYLEENPIKTETDATLAVAG